MSDAVAELGSLNPRGSGLLCTDAALVRRVRISARRLGRRDALPSRALQGVRPAGDSECGRRLGASIQREREGGLVTAKWMWRLALVFLATLSGQALGGSDTLFERNRNDGTVELTNIPEDGGNYRIVAEPADRTAAKPTVTAASPGSKLPPMPAAAAPQAPAEAGTSSADAGPVPMRDRLRALYDAARAAREAAMARDR